MNLVMKCKFHRGRQSLEQLRNLSLHHEVRLQEQCWKYQWKMMVHPTFELLVFSLADGLPASVLNLDLVIATTILYSLLPSDTV
jgi:hypothetical protein